MSTTRRVLTSTTARLVWGGLALALGAALLLSVFLSKGSIDGAEADAEAQAVDHVNTILFDAVTPEQLEQRVAGTDYRVLLAQVQAGILVDEDVTRVRIWNQDATLVFSSDQQDQPGEAVAAEDPQIAAALGGETVSLPTPETVLPRGGLAGSSEQLYRTFVPLRVAGQTGVSGVAEVDQRYIAIETAASNMWRTIRFVLIGVLTFAVIMFLVSLIPRRPAKGSAIGLETEAAPPREALLTPERLTTLKAEVRAANERAAKSEAELQAALERIAAVEANGNVGGNGAGTDGRVRELEERATGAEKRAAAAEAALQAAQRVAAGGGGPRRGVPGVGALPAASGTAEAPRTEEVQAKLQATVEERDQLTVEVARLRAALAERDAALAAPQEALTPDTSEVEKLRGLLGEYERQAAEFEQRAAGAAGRALDAEERLAQAEARLEAAEAAAEASQARWAETESARAALAAAVEELRAERSAPAPASADGGGDGPRTDELRARIQELEDLRRSEVAELQRAHEALANTQFEATQARRRMKELEEHVRELEAQGTVADDVTDGSTPEQPVEPRVVARPVGRERLREAGGMRVLDVVPAAEPEPDAEPEREPDAEPPMSAADGQELEDEQALSLRERLSRAAAARHRAPGMEESR